jgi:hypothetical protein
VGVDSGDKAVLKNIRSALGVWLGWLGVFAGVMSVISLVVRHLNIGLRPILIDFVTFYRELLKPIHELLQTIPLPFVIPAPAVEWGAGYLALFGLSLRAEFAPSRLGMQTKFAPPLLRFLYPAHVRTVPILQVFKCLLLMPVLFLQPIVDIVPHLRSRAIDSTTNYNSSIDSEPLSPGEEVLTRHKVQILNRDADEYWSGQVVQTICMFVAFPLAIVLFFILNKYSAG